MRFSIRVEAEDGEAARQALNVANIPTMGPLSTGYGGPSSGTWRTGKELVAVVDADSEILAMELVEQAFRAADIVARIGHVRPWIDPPNA